MQKGPKPAELTLSEEEHKRLEALVHRHTTPQQLAKRGRMILGAADGKRNAEIAGELESVWIRCAVGAGAGSACKRFR